MTTITPFSSNFVTRYNDAFTEFVRLGTLSATRLVQGKTSKKEDETAQRILIVLKALYRPTDVWILASGYWDDNGYWVDDAQWID